MITERATYYLVYAGLVVATFLIDMLLLKKTDKTSRVVGYVLSLIVDLSIFGFGLWPKRCGARARGGDRGG